MRFPKKAACMKWQAINQKACVHVQRPPRILSSNTWTLYPRDKMDISDPFSLLRDTL